MKHLILFTLIFFSFYGIKAQSLQDIKDFITENVTANNPLPNYANFVIFQHVIKSDIEELAGKQITDIEFDNLFVYGYDCFMDASKQSVVWSKANIIDIRGVNKVSTVFNSDSPTYYSINLYLSNGYLARKYSNTRGSGPKRDNIDKVEISLSNNKATAERIKKAIISLGKLKGVEITDGDLF